jgi:2-iminoacetate synthase ThiH
MLQFLIREAGFIPRQRDILYKQVNRRIQAEAELIPTELLVT